MAAFLVGIDLGTTNTVVASARAEDPRDVRVEPVPQLVSAGEVAARPLLPSCLYAPAAGEMACADPWCDPPWTSGAFAKRRGAEVAGRGVASSKSWLAHGAVDRHASILPWGAEGDDAPRISPVDASARTLEHVRRAWDGAHPEAPLAEQEVVLTVPASFDEAARELTLEAANAVGLMPRLLEEPTAALYDWMHRAPDRASLLSGGEALVLVCDVGGGTTDLSLIRVAPGSSGTIAATRVAVGRHVLLGGDNMDLALAHACEARMTPERLDPARFAQLVAACRDAKERLLGADAPDEVRIVVAGTGAKLVGSTLATTLTREECERLVLDGFFPRAPRDAEPVRARGGLVGFGLPYERDVAITRHVASFVARHAEGVAPTAILLNGGVFRAPRLARRIVEAIDAWGSAPLRVLEHAEPDVAVARGAVVHALARRGVGPRVGGGSSRGYYVEIAGGTGARRAVCVVPRGAPEETIQVARAHPLALVVGRPTRFELWASDEATGHAAGDLVAIDEDRFARLPPVMARFDGARGEPSTPPRRGEDEAVRVALEGELTAVGTLDLACVELAPHAGAEARRFRLAFALRGGASPTPAPPPSSLVRPEVDAATTERDARAAQRAAHVFGRKSEATEREVKDLVRDLEKMLGERATWTTRTSRVVFDAIAPGRGGRRRSPDHERVFWQLAGFCLRPGFGDPADPARVAQVAPLAAERVLFPDQARGWQQFWIAWRRIAAGLDDAQQSALRDLVDPWLLPGRAPKKKAVKPQAEPEMIDLASSLERVPASRRAELGDALVERTWTHEDLSLWGAIARVGARVPAYASVDHVVPPAIAERWVEQLLRASWMWTKDSAGAGASAAVLLARATGDRARDLGDPARRAVAKRLASVGAAEERVRVVTEVVAVEETERATFWGEALPVGLRLA